MGVKAIRPQISHEPNFLPFRFEGPTVITAHDLSWIRYPETHPGERVTVMNKLFPKALEAASHILTDAEYVRQEIVREFGVEPDRITSVPLGARSVFQPRSETDCARHSRSWIFLIGVMSCASARWNREEPRTRNSSVRAMPAAFRERHPLVTVGMKGWLTSGLESIMQPLVSSGELRPLGYTTDQALAVLYAGAMVLVYPSLYEGFGLPPLEAMASGTPVMVSNRSTLPEGGRPEQVSSSTHSTTSGCAKHCFGRSGSPLLAGAS